MCAVASVSKNVNVIMWRKIENKLYWGYRYLGYTIERGIVEKHFPIHSFYVEN